MKRCEDARTGRREAELDGGKRKTSREIKPNFRGNTRNLDIARKTLSHNCGPRKTKSFVGTNDNFFNLSSETFDAVNSSIRVQPVFEQNSAEKQKPRGGSRGVNDTQVFPAVSPGRNGVVGRIYRLGIRVSTPLAK